MVTRGSRWPLMIDPQGQASQPQIDMETPRKYVYDRQAAHANSCRFHDTASIVAELFALVGVNDNFSADDANAPKVGT